MHVSAAPAGAGASAEQRCSSRPLRALSSSAAGALLERSLEPDRPFMLCKEVGKSFVGELLEIHHPVAMAKYLDAPRNRAVADNAYALDKTLIK